MARKKRSSKAKSKSSGSKGRPAILSLAKGGSKRPAKTRVGKTISRGVKVARKPSRKSRVRGRRY